MKYGIEHEDEAAEFYSKQFGHNVYPVGLVINPSAPYLQSWPKCVGQSAFFTNCCNIHSLPPRCNVGRLVGKPFLTNNIALGEGGRVGFGPKNVCFHVKKWSMVEAVHSASLSHIILARIVGASPDRRVYDPSEDPPWGLLEIKCPQAESYVSLPYLKVNRNGLYCLTKAHEYYFQQMGCMGITGSAWCDFFVYCKNDYHHERIYFDQSAFNDMLEKLGIFYYAYFLPILVK